ncbi:undecaprenyl-diphosphate phosphatase [Pelotomaculum terephthalicicum JT]|uniref:undecaprenyl-diphosphate phosphatase n=1 Tax=Pelotomaculum terephthalicicum TaxID=206393 RepID=UPI001F03542F|nr:undecaprenyl-diphosphate phosphatase [Pelotomaculum terephthalicicum]MCG9966790.1 undecaprenyl-diphosphate phosphatase [Pelotomaculum terephthalicicum JT]
MDSFFNAIILGIVEGITEFLPISSTGHLILVNNLVGFTGVFANMFDVVIQLGAILSVVVYFWRRLFPFGGSKTIAEKREVWGLWQKTVVGVAPALLIGSILGKHVEELLFNPLTVALALVIGGVVLIIIEKRNRISSIDSMACLDYKTAFMIGLIQCLAMIPGTSRSAATIIGAMLLGASRTVAAEFSFFLAIPTMMAASAYSLLNTGTMLSYTEWQILAVGFIVSFLVAWAVIAAFMKYIQKNNFIPFGYYRIIIGIAVLYFSVVK